MARILLAEDSATELAYLREILKSTPHDLSFATNGQEAEEKARSGLIDLIILDVVMPKKDGFQICRGLKRDERFKHIPIILTTSKDGESDKFWGRKQGADEYITKPFEPEQLLSAIKKHLGGG